jgi:lycopene cyclase domain-containing protein
MTYAGFLLLFLLLPLAILTAILRKRLLNRRYLTVVSVLTLVALLYMAPWDHFAATWGLWSWTNHRTWGLRWWAIPPEEYLFCVLEALLAITLTFAVVTRKGARSDLNIATSSGKVISDGECTSTKLYNLPVPTKDEKVDREAKS